MVIIKTTLDLFCCRGNFWRSRTSFAFCSVQNRSNVNSIDDTLDTDEEELERKRFQSRLPEKVYQKFVKKEFIPPVNKEHFKIQHLRSMFGKYGEKTGLNPGIAWPTREELLEIIEHDKLFRRPLREMLDEVNAEEQERLQRQLEYEAEVEKNMEKLETYKKEYYAKIAKKQKEEQDRKLKQQQLIEEISELLGYDVDPKDPKFQEAVEMKKREEKKVKKAKKQQESYEKMLAKLANIAASGKKAEAASGDSQEPAHKEKPEIEQISKEPLSKSK